MLYLVSYSDWEDYSPSLVEGPEVPDWQAFCDSLLPEAAMWAVKNADGWVGWDNVVWGLVMSLQARGYKFLTPENANYTGSTIIDGPEAIRDGEAQFKLLGESAQVIVEHNQKIRHRIIDPVIEPVKE